MSHAPTEHCSQSCLLCTQAQCERKFDNMQAVDVVVLLDSPEPSDADVDIGSPIKYTRPPEPETPDSARRSCPDLSWYSKNHLCARSLRLCLQLWLDHMDGTL